MSKKEPEATNDQDEHVVNIFRAEDIGNKPAQITRIVINERIDTALPGSCSLKEVKELYVDQGRILADALFSSLPGGTIDVLLRELLARRASLFQGLF